MSSKITTTLSFSDALIRRVLSGTVLFGCLLMGGCATITGGLQSVGTSLGSHLGIVPDKASYTREEQDNQATAAISNEQEYYIGRAVAARVLGKFSVVDDAKLQEYVQLVGNSLLVSGEPRETFAGYHFIVIESEQLNAISAPGGYIFISTGFLKVLKSEDQLASILAHEIAHVSRRHGILILQSLSEGQDLPLNGLSTGGLNCTEALVQATALFSKLVDSLVTTLLESGYSQELEFEADAYGLEILRGIGYPLPSASGALEALKRGGRGTGSESGGWFATHPSVEERLVRIEAIESAERHGGESINSEQRNGEQRNGEQRNERFQEVLRSL